MRIVGPMVMKEEIIPAVIIPERRIEVLDEDAYWHLDFEGNEDPHREGMVLMAKVAYPTLADAQRQLTTEKLAREATRVANIKAAQERKKARRREKLEEAAAYRKRMGKP